MSHAPIIAVMGPTGAGKSAVAEALADQIGATLLNADAFQVYRGFDIGTNKPADRGRYRLIDLCEPTEQFGLGEWLRRASAELAELQAAGRSAVIVGGTGLYVRALAEGYAEIQPAPDPALRAQLMEREQTEGLDALVAELDRRSPGHQVDTRNPVRVRRALERLESPGPDPTIGAQFDIFKVGLEVPTMRLNTALGARLEAMLAAGWELEVRELLSLGIPLDAPAWRAIGYIPLAQWLSGRISRDEAVAMTLTATRQYAKRQRTWLRREPRLRSIAMGEGPEAVADAVGQTVQAMAWTGELNG